MVIYPELYTLCEMNTDPPTRYGVTESSIHVSMLSFWRGTLLLRNQCVYDLLLLLIRPTNRTMLQWRGMVVLWAWQRTFFALRHWMVSGPEMARIIQEFVWVNREGPRHRWTSSWTKETYIGGICRRFAIPEPSNWRDGNPFFEWSNDLLVLNSRDVVDTSEADTVPDIETWTPAIWNTCWREACEPDSAN